MGTGLLMVLILEINETTYCGFIALDGISLL